jgi:hypothetical protein
MVAILEVTREPRVSEYWEARRYATERLRGRTSRLANRFGLTPQQWREIARGDWPEVAGRWEAPQRTPSDQDS